MLIKAARQCLTAQVLPGVDVKIPDSAPDFGYTHDAQHAVTGACVEVNTKAEMDNMLLLHEGAWLVKLSSYLIWLHTSSPTVEGVKSQQSGRSGAGASSYIQSVFLFFASQSHQKYKKNSFSGEVKDSVIFPFYFLLHKLHKPIPPSYPLPPPTHPPIPPPLPCATP
jgi:hypothetical protein